MYGNYLDKAAKIVAKKREANLKFEHARLTAEEKDDYTDYAYYFKWKFGSWQKKAFYKDQANSIRCIVEGSKTSGSHTWGDQ